MITTQAITDFGQIKEGDVLIIEKRNGCKHVAQAKMVLNRGTDREEVVICKSKNDYFIVSMLLDGKSWVKSAVRLPDVTLTAITNNMHEFIRH